MLGQNSRSGGSLLAAVSSTAASRVDEATISTPQASTKGLKIELIFSSSAPDHWYITVSVSPAEAPMQSILGARARPSRCEVAAAAKAASTSPP